MTGVRPTVEDLRRDAAQAKRVVVVGAGMAGLSAAYQLRGAGHDVTVLEARLRPGGRVHTVRAPFAEGLHAEAGAFFVPTDHEYLMKYVRHLQLPLDPVPPRDLGSFTFVRGQRVDAEPNGNYGAWPLQLRDDEHELGLDGMMRRYVGEVVDGIGDISDPSWPPQSVAHWDELNLLDFLEQRGASSEARHLLKTVFASFLGDVGENISALFFFQQYADTVGMSGGGEVASQGNWNTIRGGNDLVPHGLAAELSDIIRYGAAAVRVEHSQDSVTVTFRQAGAYRHLTADHLICAIPFSCLREVEMSPPLSGEKRYAIENIQTTSVSHLFLQTATRPWLDGAEAAPAALGPTDLPIDHVRDATHNQPGTRGILDMFTFGHHSRALAEMAPDARIAHAAYYADRVYPGVLDEVEGAAWHDWDAEEWSRGDWVWYAPGEFMRIFPFSARPEGRVHFAGDQTSHRNSWQDGAILSGHRAAREVHEFVESASNPAGAPGLLASR